MKNQQKDQLKNIKKNLEIKLKNIVSESKKPKHLVKNYRQFTKSQLSQNEDYLNNLKSNLKTFDNIEQEANKKKQLSSRRQPSSVLSLIEGNKPDGYRNRDEVKSMSITMKYKKLNQQRALSQMGISKPTGSSPTKPEVDYHYTASPGKTKVVKNVSPPMSLKRVKSDKSDSSSSSYQGDFKQQ